MTNMRVFYKDDKARIIIDKFTEYESLIGFMHRKGFLLESNDLIEAPKIGKRIADGGTRELVFKIDRDRVKDCERASVLYRRGKS